MKFTIDWEATDSRVCIIEGVSGLKEASELGRKFYDVHVRVAELLGDQILPWIEVIKVTIASYIGRNGQPYTCSVRFKVVLSEPVAEGKPKGKQFEMSVVHCYIAERSVEELAQYVVLRVREAIKDNSKLHTRIAGTLRSLLENMTTP